MNRLDPLPPSFADTRDALQRVAVHIVARARQQATGRFGLRVTPGGFGTPEFGDDLTRVRVSGGALVRETGGTSGASNAAMPIDGATLAELARFAGVDLSAPLDVGHDTPALGDASAALAVAAASGRALGAWFALAGAALDEVVAGLPAAAAPTLVQVWPEHFDAALDLAAAPDRRVNLGGSPGDGFHADPYLYVGPWTADRPADATYWNAPFGAVLGYAELLGDPDPLGSAMAFFERGIALLAA
jgi:hypothetical protein